MSDKYSPLISVITAAWNVAPVIGKSIESVAGQDYKNVEHIIVDGLSKDDTVAVVRKYAEKYPHIQLISEKDRGVYDAMNKGIAASKGQFLFFMGSDDQFFDSRVLTDLIASGLLNQGRAVYGNVKIEGDTGWAKDGQIYDGKFTQKKLTSQNICHQAIFYPKKQLPKVEPYTIDYRINADWDLNMKLWAKAEFLFFDRVICRFIAGGTSTNATDTSFRRDYMRNIQRYFGYSEKVTREFGQHSPWGDLTTDPDNPGPHKYPPVQLLFRILREKINTLKGK